MIPKKRTKSVLITIILAIAVAIGIVSVMRCYTTCYVPVDTGYRERQSWARIKDQLPLLEKLYSEGKINDAAYAKALESLRNDIQILEKSGDEWYKNEGITKEEVDAVKKRVRELTESRK